MPAFTARAADSEMTPLIAALMIYFSAFRYFSRYYATIFGHFRYAFAIAAFRLPPLCFRRRFRI